MLYTNALREASQCASVNTIYTGLVSAVIWCEKTGYATLNDSKWCSNTDVDNS